MKTTRTMALKRIWIAALPLAAACGPGADGTGRTGGPEVVTDTLGDTIVVRTLSGSAWSGDATLVPEGSIGELEGPEEHLFGRILSIAVDDDRNVYVLDEQAQDLRLFDADGTFVRRLARRGEGPGQLSRAEAIAVLSDGRVVVRDPDNVRLQVLGPGPGEMEEWRYNPNYSYSQTPLWADRRDRTYLSTKDPSKPFGSFATMIVVWGPDGTPLDTLPPPDADFESDVLEVKSPSGGGTGVSVFPIPFSPTMAWTIHPNGGFLTGVSTDYRIELQLEEGVLRIERDYDPVPVSPAERDFHRESIERGARNLEPRWKLEGPSIPETKPPFRALYAGRGGRIWVVVSTAGHSVDNEYHDPDSPYSRPVRWIYPLRFDVFEPDGTYLGAVNPPDDFSAFPPPVFDGDYVWAVTRDDLDVERVVRYRIEVESGGR